jgi:hypothetical protein
MTKEVQLHNNTRSQGVENERNSLFLFFSPGLGLCPPVFVLTFFFNKLLAL